MLNEKFINSSKIKNNSLTFHSKSKILLLDNKNRNFIDNLGVLGNNSLKDNLNYHTFDEISINSKVKKNNLSRVKKISPSKIPVMPPDTIYHSKYQNFKSKIPMPS